MQRVSDRGSSRHPSILCTVVHAPVFSDLSSYVESIQSEELSALAYCAHVCTPAALVTLDHPTRPSNNNFFGTGRMFCLKWCA